LGDAPDLNGYGSREWLIGIISNPANPRFYGKKNDRMPIYAESTTDPAKNTLSAREIELVADCSAASGTSGHGSGRDGTQMDADERR